MLRELGRSTTTNLFHVTSQKSEVLKYITAESWKLTMKYRLSETRKSASNIT